MDFGAGAGSADDANPVDQALDQLTVGLDHLVKLVEDGGLDHFDDPGLVGFLQSFEQGAESAEPGRPCRHRGG